MIRSLSFLRMRSHSLLLLSSSSRNLKPFSGSLRSTDA
jgi:hypothetical protein